MYQTKIKCKYSDGTEKDMTKGEFKVLLHVKKRLVKKLKAVFLYRPSDGLVGAEECFQQSTTRLQIAYNWPLSLCLGEITFDM